MRILNKSANVKITVNDPVDGIPKEFVLRMPSSSERVEYFSALAECGSDNSKSYECRINAVKKLLVSIPEEQFGYEKDGIINCISSNKENQDYTDDWREIIAENAPELLAVMAVSVYESTAVIKKNAV